MKKLLIIISVIVTISVFVFYKGRDSVEPISIVTNSEPVRAKVRKKRDIPKLELPNLNLEMPPVTELDPLIAKIVGLTEVDLGTRSKLVWRMRNRDLRESDFRAIYSFLKSNPNEEGAALHLHSLKNNLLVLTIADGRFKETTAQVMIDIINDDNQHEVMREYVLQYVPDYFEKHWLESNTVNRKEKSNLSEMDKNLQLAFINSMWNMLQVKEGPIPGTSLIRLHELSGYFPAIPSIEIEEATEEMVFDDSMPISSRMAALSIAKERQLYQVLDKAVSITFDSSSPISLRMSALNTASMLSPDEEFYKKVGIDFIENIEADRRLKKAAILIIKELNKRRG